MSNRGIAMGTERVTAGDKKPYLGPLAGLRFAAAFLVLCFHLEMNQIPGMPRRLGDLFQQGSLGVSLFFVLSGFILTYTHADRAEDTAENRRAFFQARFARIYPVYLFGLLVSAPEFFAPLGHATRDKVLPLLLAAIMVLTLLQAWSSQTVYRWNFPSWSLSNEAFFYVLFPRLLPRLLKWSGWALLLVVPILWFLGQIPYMVFVSARAQPGLLSPQEVEDWDLMVRYNPAIRLPEFIMGIACGVLFLRHFARPEPRERRRAAFFSVAIALLLMVLFLFSADLPLCFTESLGFLAPLYAVLVYSLAFRSGPLAWLMGRPITTLLGEASYAMYILHIPVIRAVYRAALLAGYEEEVKHTWSFCLVAMAAVIAAALLTYLLVERPSNRLLRSWFASRELKVKT